MFLYHLVIPDLSIKFNEDRPRETPPSGAKRQRRSQDIAILDVSKAISRKRCKIGGKLLLIINRKSHMIFRLVPKSVILNDHERRNGPNGCLISSNSVVFWADCVTVVKDTGYFMRQKCRPNNVVFNYVSFMAMLAGNHPKR